MTIDEVDLFLSGYQKRQIRSWEQTRILAYLTAQVNSTKQLEPTDILRFDWDEKPDREEVTEDEVERLRKLAKEVEKIF